MNGPEWRWRNSLPVVLFLTFFAGFLVYLHLGADPAPSVLFGCLLSTWLPVLGGYWFGWKAGRTDTLDWQISQVKADLDAARADAARIEAELDDGRLSRDRIVADIEASGRALLRLLDHEAGTDPPESEHHT